MLRFVGPDDWTMVLAALMALATFICFCGESKLGMGRHSEWQQPSMWVPYFQWLFAHGLMVMLGLVLVKISIAFFLMRIMLQKAWKIFLWSSVGQYRYHHMSKTQASVLIVSVFLICFGLACSGTLIFGCMPISANWDFNVRMDPNTRCFSSSTYGFIGLFNSIINIITDILFAVLPIPIILKLQVNKRTKISLIVIVSLGLFACFAGIFKARLQTTVMTTPDQQFENLFHIWYMLELSLGILAASLPTLKPLFAAALDGTRSRLGTHSRSRVTGGAHGGISHASRVRPNRSPTSFPNPTMDVDLGHYKKSSGGANVTVGEASSEAGSSDVDTGKSPYDVRVTGGQTLEYPDQWEGLGVTRNGSQERLHHPASGIFKRVEMTHTSEVAR